MKHEVEVILVGDELLKGERRDEHLASSAKLLATIGVRIDASRTVRDDLEQIGTAVSDAVATSRVLLVCGGLGPTPDDVTREGVARGLGLPLEFNDEEWQVIQKIFAGFGRTPGEANRKQALFPAGATPIPNTRGTAAGFVLEHEGCLVFVLPGPPHELNTMVEKAVLPAVKRVIQRPAVFVETFRTTAIGESTLVPIIEPIVRPYGEFMVSSLPRIAGVDIVITGKRNATDEGALEGRARELEAQLRKLLGSKLYGKGTQTLESVVGGALAARGETVAVAESLTGGLIGKRFTDTPGSSGYFLSDVVAYSNKAKRDFLGVSEGSLESYGAVSEAVCREMADGIRRRTGATYGLAATGIAGPMGGTDEKPVGLCFYGLSWDGGVRVEKRVFHGHRPEVRERVATATLFLLHDRLWNG